VGKFIRVPPTKARLVIDLIRGKKAGEALNILRFSPKTAARVVEKVLKSAIANAQHNDKVKDVDALVVKTAFVNEGPMQKRIRPRAMGRAFRIRHRTSHVTITLDQP
jgi:large subunit ribosomal protein L22